MIEKKEIAGEVVREISQKFDCDLLTSSILARRNKLSGNDIMFYLENDLRYTHNPFLFINMEDAVDRIFDAKSEGEKVLIFGDRDVDGISSTTILYQCLKEMGLDVSWRIPTGNDEYGLTIQAVDDFALSYGTLIITVDCGISNVEEIKHAQEKGIDVIVVDHHNPQDEIPDGAIIINPKMNDSGYPFQYLAGCGVTYKLITALRFAMNELYKQEICLLNIRPANDSYVIESVKLVNLVEIDRISETIIPGLISIEQTRILPFLKGQQIFVWNMPQQKKMLEKAFGSAVDFQLMDIQIEIAKVFPAVENLSLLRIKDISKVAKYKEMSPSELDGFLNLFTTFVLQKTSFFSKNVDMELQLLTLATLADIMPLVDENRILLKKGLDSINTGKIRPGLIELFSKQNLLGKKLSSTDLAFYVVPVINATGRLGQPETAIELFTEENSQKRDELALKIIHLNDERKQLTTDTLALIEKQAFDSVPLFSDNFVVVADNRVHRGITGILANKFAQEFKIPSIVMTKIDDENGVGSIRSLKDFDVTPILEQCADLFIKHGGHNCAAGFSYKMQNQQEIIERLKQISTYIEVCHDVEEKITVDAELPHNFLTPNLLKLVDKFEPYGEANPPLTFMAKNLKIIDAMIMGKSEKQHLKLTFSCNQHKWPALYWNAASRFNRDFNIGNYVDVIFQISRNTYNGVETPQMIITDVFNIV